MTGRIRIFVLACACVQAQYPARSPEEFDDYLIVEGAKEAETAVAACVRFQRRWPQSALLPEVLERRFLALRELGRPKEAAAVAREALGLAPERVNLRAAYAVWLAGEAPAEAREQAKLVLRGLEEMRSARTVPMEEVKAARARIEARARTAMGLALFREEDSAGALRELEAAERLFPEPSLWLRLGRLYAAMGRTRDARARLEQAARSDDMAVAEMARSELRAILK